MVVRGIAEFGQSRENPALHEGKSRPENVVDSSAFDFPEVMEGARWIEAQ